MEQTECSETLAYKVQKPGNYPEERIQHSEHGESLKSRRVKNILPIKILRVTTASPLPLTALSDTNTKSYQVYKLQSRLDVKLRLPIRYTFFLRL
jgi:hypothetical protein